MAAELALRQLENVPDRAALLSLIFPELSPRRYRATGERLRRTLQQASATLAAMAVPFAFTAYERYGKRVLSLLRILGRCQLEEIAIQLLGLENLHAAVADIGMQLPA